MKGNSLTGKASFRPESGDLVPKRSAKIVCIGHSHSRTVYEAALRQNADITYLNFWNIPNPVIRGDGEPRFRETVSRALKGSVFSMIGGASHMIMGLARHPRPFDFVLPECPEQPLDEKAEIIPLEAVRASLLATTQEYLDLIALVRKTSIGPVFHMEAPPPYEDGDRLLADIPWMFFEGMQREVSPAAFRFKLWRLHSQIVRESCRRQGIFFVEHPAESVDANGFLRPEFYFDSMHVNENYGALLLEQMKRLA